VKQRVKVAERRMVEVAVANIIVGMVCVVYVQSVKKWCMVSKRGGQYYAVKELMAFETCREPSNCSNSCLGLLATLTHLNPSEKRHQVGNLDAALPTSTRQPKK
jgi:hypothetical protein